LIDYTNITSGISIAGGLINLLEVSKRANLIYFVHYKDQLRKLLIR